MSKISAIKLQLAQILASFSSVDTDKGVLQWADDCEPTVGIDVYVEGTDGSFVLAEDGEYVARDGRVFTIVSGKIESIKDPNAEVSQEDVPAEVKAEEAPVEQVVEEAPVATVEEVVEEPVVDPIEGIKQQIEEVAGIVATLVEKVAAIEAEAAITKETLEKMSKISVAMAAQVEVEKVATGTGNPKLDARLKEMFK